MHVLAFPGMVVGGNENEVVEVADFPDDVVDDETQNGILTAAAAQAMTMTRDDGRRRRWTSMSRSRSVIISTHPPGIWRFNDKFLQQGNCVSKSHDTLIETTRTLLENYEKALLDLNAVLRRSSEPSST